MRARRLADDVGAVDQDLAVGRVFVSGDHAQHCCFAAAAGAQQAAIAASFDAQIDAVHLQRPV